MAELGNLYEEKFSFPKDTFTQQTEKKVKQAEAKKKPFISSPSGPEEADGFKKEIIDPKTAKKDNYFEPKKFSQNNEKTELETINTFMNKSIFDKLYEDVMSDEMSDIEAADAEALGLPGDEGVADETGEVTITLDRELAQKLHDVLMGVLEAGEAEGEAEGELEGEAEGEVENEDAEEKAEDEKEEDSEEEVGEEEAEETLGEATDLQELPASKGASLQSKNNKVGDVTAKLTSKGGGDAKVTDECGNKDTGKHALVQDLDSGNLKGKNNKVASKTSRVGEYLAGLK